MQNDYRKLIGRMSEEGLVSGAALLIQGYAIYARVSSTFTTLLLFAALGTYLTLRLLRSFGLPKD